MCATACCFPSWITGHSADRWLGGADSLTSKVAVIGPSTHPDADVDYLFLQVVVNEPRVDSSQNCGNMLAGVAPFRH